MAEYKGKSRELLITALGTFKLNTQFKGFEDYEGEIDYLGETANVSLSLSEDGTADAALIKLEEICEDLAGFDAKLREEAAEELYSYVPDWYDEELSREEFKAELSVPYITVNEDGSVEAMLDCGEIFADHGILVWLDPDGSPTGADLVG